MITQLFLSRRNNKNKTETTIPSEQLQEHHPKGNDAVEEGKNSKILEHMKKKHHALQANPHTLVALTDGMLKIDNPISML